MSTLTRILLVGNYEPDRQHSMLRYADWLAKGLRQSGHRVDLVAPRPILRRLAGDSAIARKWLGLLDKFALFTIALMARAGRYDMVHICDHTNAFYALALRLVLRSKAVGVTCHDLIPIKVLAGEVKGETLPATGRYLQRLVRFALKRVSHVTYVSEATEADFLRLIRRPDGVTGVIHNPVIGFGAMGMKRACELMKRANLPTDRRFLLHIGSNLWYKNRVGAVRLFGLLRENPQWTAAFPGAYMVSIGPPLPEAGRNAARDWQQDLIVVSEPSPDLIEALYTRAGALLFPSLDEGFGWPIIEAQACGCPVITSDSEPMRSVAGASALLIDPTDLPASARAIACRWNWLMAQSDKARAHAQAFSEQSATAQYEAFLAKVLASAAVTSPR